MRGVLAQEIHHRVKNNLQTVASLLRLQARAENVEPRKALQDSVNRILAIAAVHEVLTEHREDDVELGELVDRLRAMLVQGLVAGKEVSAGSSPSRSRAAGHRARARLHRALPERARARRRPCVDRPRAKRRRRRAHDRRRRRRHPWRGHRDGALDRAGLVRDELPERSSSQRRGASAPRWCSPRDEGAHRRGRDAHPARPQGLLEDAGFEVCAEARDGEEAVALARETRAGRRAPRREDATARRHRGGPAHPRRAADPDRDGDRLRGARARLASGRGRRLRLPRQALPRDRSPARDRDRNGPARGAPRASRGGRVARRGARRPQGDRAREGDPHAARGAHRGGGVRAAAEGEPDLRAAAEGGRRGADRDPRRRDGRVRASGS